MKSLLFVYNASSGYWNKKVDAMHKILSPSTYNCNLCALTHTKWKETEIWKDFRTTANIEMEFMYKDEFQERYPKMESSYPVIYKIEHGKSIEVFMTREALEEIETTETLITKIKTLF